MTEAYIVAGYRTAVGKATKGGFRFTRPDDLAVDVIQHLLAAVPQLDPSRIDDLIVGNAVPEAEQGLQVGRMIAVRAMPDELRQVVRQGLERLALEEERRALLALTQQQNDALRDANLLLEERDARAARIKRLCHGVSVVTQAGDNAQSCDDYSFCHRSRRTPLI